METAFFLVLESGRARIDLGARLHIGGEAEIRPVPAYRDCVAKIYHRGTRSSHASRQKLEAMLAKKPSQMTCRANGVELPQFAWPTHIIEDEGGEFRGFLMRKMPTASSELLSSYMSRSQMRRTLSENDCSLPRRVLICANLAAAITELHRLRHFFVDIKPANIAMFKDTGILCLLDNDSFSVEGDGSRFPATAFTREYLAPELILNELSASAVITDWQDRFALAVLIFQIFNNGIHPFQAVPCFETEEWNIDMCVKQGLYAYGLTPNPLVSPAPASVHSTWPVAVRELFDRAFVERQGSKRPSAQEWRDHLGKYQGTFERCSAKPQDVRHIHFAGAGCAECLFDELSARRNLAGDAQRVGGSLAAQGVRSPDVGPSQPDRRPMTSTPVVAGVSTPALPRTAIDPPDAQASPESELRTAAYKRTDDIRSQVKPPVAGRYKAKRVAAAVVAIAVALFVGVSVLQRPKELNSPTSIPEASPVDPVTTATTGGPPASEQPTPAVAPETSQPTREATPTASTYVQSEGDSVAIEARLDVLRKTLKIAADANGAEMMQIINLGLAGDDEKTLSEARTLMRNTDFIGVYANWNYTRTLGRNINDAVIARHRSDTAAAVVDQSRALALAPVDREVAANLAYYLALSKQKGAMSAAVYSLSLPRPAGLTGTAQAWQIVGVAFALAGNVKESQGAFDVGLAITTKLPAFCKNLLAYQRDIGPALNAPITAVFKRINERGQSGEEGCAFPPQWMQ